MSLKKLSKAEKAKMKSRIVESGKLSELLGSEKEMNTCLCTMCNEFPCTCKPEKRFVLPEQNVNGMINNLEAIDIHLATESEVYGFIFDQIFEMMDKDSRIWCDETSSVISDKLCEKYYIIPKEGK